MRILLAILTLWTVRHNPCAVDVDNSGAVDVYDWLTFAGWYFDGNIAADWNGDGKINRLDATAFIDEWGEGC